VAASEAGNVAALMAEMPAALDHYPRSVDLVDDLAYPTRSLFFSKGSCRSCGNSALRQQGAQMLGAYDLVRSFYWNDFIREVALRHGIGARDRARAGHTFSFSDTIA
jgi:hypothetical protein